MMSPLSYRITVIKLQCTLTMTIHYGSLQWSRRCGLRRQHHYHHHGDHHLRRQNNASPTHVLAFQFYVLTNRQIVNLWSQVLAVNLTLMMKDSQQQHQHNTYTIHHVGVDRGSFVKVRHSLKELLQLCRSIHISLFVCCTYACWKVQALVLATRMHARPRRKMRLKHTVPDVPFAVTYFRRNIVDSRFRQFNSTNGRHVDDYAMHHERKLYS